MFQQGSTVSSASGKAALKVLATTDDANLFHTPSGTLTGGIAANSSGILFFSNGHNIGSIEPDGNVRVYRTDSPRFASIDGPIDSARFTDAGLMAMDFHDNLYIADAGRIRKASPDLNVTTIADLHPKRGHDLRPLVEINGLAADTAQNVYAATVVFVYDGRADNYSVVDRSVIKIDHEGKIAVFEELSQFDDLGAIRFDVSDNMYFLSGVRIMKRNQNGAMTIVADLGGKSRPSDILVDLDDSLYMADLGQNAILKVTPDGKIAHVMSLGMPKAMALLESGRLSVIAKGGIYEITLP